jgi:hypothetical protein
MQILAVGQIPSAPVCFAGSERWCPASLPAQVARAHSVRACASKDAAHVQGAGRS